MTTPIGIDEVRNDPIVLETATEQETKTQEVAEQVFVENEKVEQAIEKKELTLEATPIEVTAPAVEEKKAEEVAAAPVVTENKETAPVVVEAAPVAAEPAKVAEPVQQTAEKTQAAVQPKNDKAALDKFAQRFHSLQDIRNYLINR